MTPDEINYSDFSQEELVEVIVMCANELGWNIALPSEEDNDMVEGLVLGTDNYIKDILGEIVPPEESVRH